MTARAFETALAALAFVLAIAGGYLALRGVQRDTTAFEEAAQLMIGFPGRSADALRWVIAGQADRTAGALNIVTESPPVGSEGHSQGCVAGRVRSSLGDGERPSRRLGLNGGYAATE